MPHAMVPDTDSPESILARAAHGQRSMLLSHTMRVGCKVISVLVLARLVAPSEHGLYAMAASLTLLLTLFRDFGLGTAAVQAPHLTEDDRTTLHRAHVLLGIVLFVATLALIPALVGFYREPRLAPLAALMSVHFLFLGINTLPRVLLSRDLQFATLNRIETAAVLLSTAVMIAAGALGAGAYAFACFLLTFEGSLMLLVRRSCSWRPLGGVDWTRLRPLLRTGADLTVVQTVTYLGTQIDTFAVGRWFGPRALGLYTRPAQLLLLPIQHLATPLSQVLVSSLSRTSPAADEFRIQFQRTTTLVLYLTLPFAACCIVLPFDIVRVLLGPHWAEAAPLLRWFGVGAVFAALGATLPAVAIALRRTRRLAVLALLSLLVSAAVVLAFRHSGPVVIAAAIALSQGVLLVPRIFWLLGASTIHLRDYAAAVIGPLLVALAFALGLLCGRAWAEDSSTPFHLMAALSGGLAAIALLASMSPRLRHELRDVCSHLPVPARLIPQRKANA